MYVCLWCERAVYVSVVSVSCVCVCGVSELCMCLWSERAVYMSVV